MSECKHGVHFYNWCQECDPPKAAVSEIRASTGETPRTDAARSLTLPRKVFDAEWQEDYVTADFARTLERELAEATTRVMRNAIREGEALTRAETAEKNAERYLDAIFQMADDGWLMHGVEGMSDLQEAVYKITQEHPTYKARVLAARKEGQ